MTEARNEYGVVGLGRMGGNLARQALEKGRYEAYDTPEVKSIHIPQQEWAGGPPPLGANGLPVARGIVASFDVDAGVGAISNDASDEDVFFSFTAIPGEGYRTLRPGMPVSFELVQNEAGPTARNVRRERAQQERSAG